jgi:hypothetical protein
MPYTITIPASWDRSLEEMAQLLLKPRQLLGELEDRHSWLPSTSSLAAADIADSDLPEGYGRRPLENASTYLFIGAHHLGGIAAAFREREVLFVPQALGRVAFEHAIRAVLAVDPNLTARQRVARAILDDVISAYFARLAVKELADGDRSGAPFKQADDKWKVTKEAAVKVGEVDWSGSPSGWNIAGISQLGFGPDGAAAKEWRRLRGSVPGAGFYAALSLYTHPQSLAEELDGSGLRADPRFIARCAMNALVCSIDALRALCDYLGWDPPELEELSAATTALSP